MKKQLWPFVTFWVLDSILLYLAAWFYPFYFTLGNAYLNMLWAAVFAGFVWTVLEWIATPIVRMGFKLKGEVIMFGFYFLVNFIALWLTARMSPIFGFGAENFVWLVFLAILADIFQYFIWKIAGFKKITK